MQDHLTDDEEINALFPVRPAATPEPISLKPVGWIRKQDGLEYAPVMALYAMKPAPENGTEPVEMYARDQVEYMLGADPKDTAAIIEIDKVMLEASAHWLDVETDAMVVRHVKELTRMLNAALVTPATTPGAPEQTDNIISLVQRLALALRQANPVHPLPEKAIDYLRSAGVIVSPLRKVVQPCTGCNGRGEVGGLRQDGYHSEMCLCCQGSGQEQVVQPS